MPLTITPFAVPAGSAVTIGTLPAGPFYAAVSAGSASTAGIFVGMGTALTASNGMFVPGGAAPVSIPGYPSQASQPLYAIAQAGTVTATLLISQPG